MRVRVMVKMCLCGEVMMVLRKLGKVEGGWRGKVSRAAPQKTLLGCMGKGEEASAAATTACDGALRPKFKTVPGDLYGHQP